MKKNILSVLVLLIISLIFFKDAILYQKLPIPSDAIVSLYHPYRDFYQEQFPRGYPFKNFLITDPLRQQYPWRELAISAEKKLELPLWNPYNGAGEPLLANIQSASLYPLNILFFTLPFSLAWSILLFLQPLMASAFLYIYLRNLRISAKASLLGAIAFAFGGFNTTWLEWGTIVHTGLWLPLILLSIDKIFYKFSRLNSSNFKKQNSKIEFKIKDYVTWPFTFILSLSAALFAGHLQTFFYLSVFVVIYFLARWFQYGKQKNILLLFPIAALLFVAITFVQWFPTLQLINNSGRDIDQIWQKDGWFIPINHLVQFIAPDFFGNPTTLNYWGTWNYGELTGYIGILPLIMAFYAIFIRRDKKTIFFASSVLIALTLATLNFIAKIPFLLSIPFISTAQPTRLLFIVDFSLSVLAALGFDYFLKNKKKPLISAVFISIIMLGLWIAVTVGSASLNISAENAFTAKRNLILPGILLGSSFLLITSFKVFSKKKKMLKILSFLVIVITIFDLLRFSWKFNTFTDKNLLFPQTNTIKFLSGESRDYPWRFLGVDYVDNQKRVFAPNLSSHDKLYTIDTYNPLLLKRYQEFAAVSEWGFTDIPDYSFNRSIALNNYESKLIDFLGVKYVVAINDTYSRKLKFLFREGETRVYENTEVFDRAFMVYDVLIIKNKQDIARKMYDKKTDLRRTAIVEENLPMQIQNRDNITNDIDMVEYDENSIEIDVSTANNGLLVLTDTFYPIWRVKVDGKEEKIYRTNYNFRGVIVPKGEHKIQFYNSLI